MGQMTNRQCQSTEKSSSPKDRLQSHHVTNLHMHAIYNNTHTKMNLSTVKLAQ